MRRTWLSLLIPALLVCSLGKVQSAENAVVAEPADGMKPVVMVSFAGYDALLEAADVIGKLSDSPLSPMLNGVIQAQLGEDALAAIDTKRPWGAIVQTDGSSFPAVAFLPVKNLKKLLESLESRIGKAKETGEGTYELETKNGQTIYLADKAGWAFVSSSADHLARAPKDPVKVLGELPKSYTVAVRAVVKNVPPLARQMMLLPLQMGIQQGAERKPDESDEQYALRTKLTKQAMQQFTDMLNDLDTLQVGVQVNSKSSTAHLDYQVTATPGTKTARQMADMKGLKSSFSGFYQPSAAVAFDFASKVAESDSAQLKSSLQAARAGALKELEKQDLSEADLKRVRKWVGDLMDVLEKTLQSGRMNAGATLALDAKQLTFTAGAYLAETAKLDTLVREVVAEGSKEKPQLAEAFKFDAESHAGVKFHVFSLPTAALDKAADRLTPLVGETFTVVLGIGPESAYLSAGRDAAKTLKSLIDGSKAAGEKAVPPMRLSIAAGAIARAVESAAQQERPREIAGKVAKVLASTPSQDHITVTSTAVPNGGKVRIELQQGVLKLLGALPSLAQGN